MVNTEPLMGGGAEATPDDGEGAWWYLTDPDQGLSRMGWGGKQLEPGAGICAKGAGLFGGVHDDFRRRMPRYWKDIRQGLGRKTLSASLFMFFATFFSTASLGALIQKTTNKRIGLEEYLIMNSLAGMAHALLGCQPLLVLRPTGPITLICTMLCMYADKFGFDFNQYLGATGFFVGIYMALIAGTEFCMLIKYLTRFTHDIFAFFVCSIYIHDGVSAVVAGFKETDARHPQPNEADFGESLYSTLLAVLVFAVSMWLNFAVTWRAFNDTVRGLLTDYAVTIAVFATIVLSNAFAIEKSHVPRIEVPLHFGPTCARLANATAAAPNASLALAAHPAPGGLPWADYDCSDCVCESKSGCTCIYDAASAGGGMVPVTRSWLTSYADAPPALWLAAAVSALPIVMFFYFDQNLSSLLTQQPHMRLRFGSYYHSSFLAMGVFNFIGPSFGLPFVTGSLPHSPQLVKALTVYRRAPDGAFEAVGVDENRLAPLLMYFLIGLPVFFPHMLQEIPQGALNGVLTFVGVAGLLDCQLWERLLCLLRAPSAFHARYRGLAWQKVHLFTLLQVTCFALFWVANSLSFFCVPPLIVVTVFLRKLAFVRLFTAAELAQLDDDGTQQGEGAGAAPGGRRDAGGASSAAARTGGFGIQA